MTDDTDGYVQRFVARAAGIHDAIAGDLADTGGLLRCQKCPAGQPLGDIAGYLRDGWPQHCGRTMLWVSQKLLDEERAGGPGGD